MTCTPIFIDFYENTTNGFEVIHNVMKLHSGSKIINSTIKGPLYLNRFSQIGPHAEVGKYVGMNQSCFFARGVIGAYCSIGARTAINPFNHPTSWLSTHEYQYQPQSFDWVPEYSNFARLKRTQDMFAEACIGNDVWMGHNVVVLANVKIGDGAIIAAGSIVTKDIPPYAIAAGNPATIKKFRFEEKIIERLLNVRWWDFELSEISGLNFREINECLPKLEEMRAESILSTTCKKI